MNKLLVVGLLILVVVGLGVFGLTVWPTQWRYDQITEGRRWTQLRTNRVTGTVEILSESGWVRTAAAKGEKVPGDLLPPQEFSKLVVNCGIEARVHGGIDDAGLIKTVAVTVTNGSKWIVTSINVSLDVRTATGTMPHLYQIWGFAPGFLGPGASATVSEYVTEPLASTACKVVGADGQPQID